jgi:hypothetical protein
MVEAVASSVRPEEMRATSSAAAVMPRRLNKKSSPCEIEQSRKRESEVPLGELENDEQGDDRGGPCGADVQMQLLEILKEEEVASSLDVREEEQVRLENGVDWAPVLG